MSEENLQEEIKQLKIENSKLARELRITRDYFEKVNRTLEAKETLGKALSAANLRQKAYTNMLLENCPAVILLLDDKGQLVLCTDNFLRLTGSANIDYLKSRPYTDIFSPFMDAADIAEFEAAIGEVAAEKKQVFIKKWIDFGKTGESRYYSIELNGVGGGRGQDAGISAGILAVFIDLTDVQMEKDRAEAASRAKSDFLAVMSHEIRTPMNAILGLNEILSRTELTSVQGKYLSDIRKSANSLLVIINDILDFSKIEAGKLEIINSNYNLRSLLDNLYSMFSILFKAKKLFLNFNISDNIPASVYGDENRTRQILTNILSNAMKYTREGHVDFSAWMDPAGEGSVEMLRFDTRDTGIGIRKEDAEKLFRPFEQLDTRKNRNVVGTGLGLAIGYRLCQLMGGNLWLESEYGKGSCFSVSVPYIPATEHADETEIDYGDFSAPDAKILVVDDIDINLEVCSAMLEAFNIKADLVSSGRQAIEAAAEKHYDIIFMDHMMPEMDGIETTHHIRSLNKDGEGVPIIALTANVINGAEQMFVENKFNGLLAKPIEMSALNQCLRQWLPADKIINSGIDTGDSL